MFDENEYFQIYWRIDYLVRACKGFCFLHDNHIIHQDIKPSNMLVNGPVEKDIVNIFDDMTTMKDTVTSTVTQLNTNFIGVTLIYLAPEIAKKSIYILTKMTDVYSFGISMFEICNLHSPWETSSST